LCCEEFCRPDVIVDFKKSTLNKNSAELHERRKSGTKKADRRITIARLKRDLMATWLSFELCHVFLNWLSLWRFLTDRVGPLEPKFVVSIARDWR
jgi:hypothetical protein